MVVFLECLHTFGVSLANLRRSLVRSPALSAPQLGTFLPDCIKPLLSSKTVYSLGSRKLELSVLELDRSRGRRGGSFSAAAMGTRGKVRQQRFRITDPYQNEQDEGSFEPLVDQAMLRRKLKEEKERSKGFNRTTSSTGWLNNRENRGREEAVH